MKHEEGYFKSFDGKKLFWQSWLPEGAACGQLFFVHGAFEHSGRFNESLSFFARAGLRVTAFDLRGHGRSEGEINADSSFMELVRDMEFFLSSMRQEGQRFFLMGQSLGAALLIMYLSRGSMLCDGLILCSSPVKPCFHPVSILAAYALSKVVPNFKLKKLEARLIARDPKIVEQYENDPLVNRQGIPVKPFSEFLQLMKQSLKEFEHKNLPLLVLHGTRDLISDIKGSKALFERSCSLDKTLKIKAGFYHDLLNDPGKDTLFQDIEGWIKKHL